MQKRIAAGTHWACGLEMLRMVKLELYHGEKKKKKTSNGNFKLNFDGLFDSLSEFSVAGFVVHN